MTIEKTETGSTLAIRDDQTGFTNQQVAALRQMGVDRASDGDLAVFFHQAQRTGLDPFARQIYMIERQGKQTIQTGIDGFRLVARRATDASRGSLGYEDTQWCGEDGVWHDVWLQKGQPAAARVTVTRNGDRFPAIALFSEYAATKRDGSLTQMWATKGALMLAKCAEALALRKAFPQDLSGLYTSDEMQQAGNGAPTQTRKAPIHSGTSGIKALAKQGEQLETENTVTWNDVESCEDVDQLRAMWKRAPEELKSAIEARVEDLKTDAADPDTGEIVDAELVDPWEKEGK